MVLKNDDTGPPSITKQYKLVISITFQYDRVRIRVTNALVIDK